MSVPKVHLDFEVRSPSDLPSVGLSRYVADPGTTPICLAWAIGDDEPKIWAPGYFAEAAGRSVDDINELFRAIERAELHAWNVSFERAIWALCEKLFDFPPVPFDRWRCSMAQAARVGLPLALDSCAKAMGALRKDAEGSKSMKSIIAPIKRKKPESPDQLRLFGNAGEPEFRENPRLIRETFDYCIDDVKSERSVAQKVPAMTEEEILVWQLDQRINDRGVWVDRELCEASVDMVFDGAADGGDEISKLTDGFISKPTQTAKVRQWCEEQGVYLPNLRAETVEEAIDREDIKTTPEVLRVLQLRSAGSKSSTAKFSRVLEVVGGDDRLRGSLQYCGAFTGRWAGRKFQPHNLPRGEKLHVENYDHVISLFRSRLKSSVELLYGPVGSVAKSIIRGAIGAAPGHRLCVWDFSQIEARVLAWTCNDRAALDPFAKCEDPYKALAATIYGKSIVDVNNYERMIGKIAVLGLGYQMGARRFFEMLPDGLDMDFAEFVVQTFREKFHRIRAYWYATERAAIEAIATPDLPQYVDGTEGRISYCFVGDFLRCKLPSGRCIFYYKPRLRETIKFGRPATEIVYLKNHKGTLVPTTTYGGKLVENNTQSSARDVMVSGMFRLDDAGIPLVLTVHDEVLGEVPEAEAEDRLEEGRRLLCVNDPWSQGLPIAADDPFICSNYRKG